LGRFVCPIDRDGGVRASWSGRGDRLQRLAGVLVVFQVQIVASGCK